MNIKEAKKILNLNDNYTKDDLKTAYKNQIKKYHPDLNNNKKENIIITQKINEAYNILKDSKKSLFTKEELFDLKKAILYSNLNMEVSHMILNGVINKDLYYYNIYKKYSDIIKEKYESFIEKINFYKDSKLLNEDLKKFYNLIQIEVNNFIDEVYLEYYNKYNKIIFNKKTKVLLIEQCDINKEKLKSKNYNLADALTHFIETEKEFLINIYIETNANKFNIDEEEIETIKKEVLIETKDKEYTYKNIKKEIKKKVKKRV